MKYLIAHAKAGEYNRKEIFIIPITQDLVSVIHFGIDHIVDVVESIRLYADEMIYAYRVLPKQWPNLEPPSRTSFRKFIENEIGENEFSLTEANAAMNEDILQDIAEQFTLGINLFASTAIFEAEFENKTEYNTFEIPLSWLQLGQN